MKHGETSRQMQHLATALALVPGTRKALLRLMARQRRQQARARTVATTILANLLHSTPARRQSTARGVCDHRTGYPPPPPPRKVTKKQSTAPI
jgi:hypothetical protein